MPDSGRDEHQGRFPIGEVPYDLGPATNLSVETLQRVVGPKSLPVFRGEVEVAQRFLAAVLHDRCGLPELHGLELFDDGLGLFPGGPFRSSRLWTASSMRATSRALPRGTAL